MRGNSSEVTLFSQSRGPLKMLKAYGYIKTGHPTRNVLTSQEQEIPEVRFFFQLLPLAKGSSQVGPDQILVRVKAAAINPVDAQLANTPNEDLKGQFKSLGFDYSGEVIKVGSNVAKSGFQGLDLKAGTNVFGLPLNMYTQSTLATHLLLGSSDPQAICIKPDNMSHAQAASIPLVFLTSFTAMCRDAKLGDHTGELSVAVIGASGGTGIYGVNVAKHYYKAAKVVGVCSSRNVDFVKGLGADVVVDYTKEDPLTRLVEEGPFDLVYDCVGGTQWFDRLDKLVKPSGYFLTIVGDKTDRRFVGSHFDAHG
jgi:NADPH:quinone reductase-like Zn-dependent oxidoreductase